MYMYMYIRGSIFFVSVERKQSMKTNSKSYHLVVQFLSWVHGTRSSGALAVLISCLAKQEAKVY